MKNKRQVPVIDQVGNLIGYVSESLTSVGVSKLMTKHNVVGVYEFSAIEVDGKKQWGWRPKNKSLAQLIGITLNS
jgi:hypothetical protein